MAVREGLCAGAPPFGAVAARRCLASLGSNPRGFSPSHKLLREFQAQKKPHCCSSLIKMAVREGFEPSIRCRIHTFQACSFSHSDTSPFLIPCLRRGISPCPSGLTDDGRHDRETVRRLQYKFLIKQSVCSLMRHGRPTGLPCICYSTVLISTACRIAFQCAGPVS